MNTEHQPIDWPVGRIAGLTPGLIEQGKGANAYGGHAIAVRHSAGPIILIAQDKETLAKVWQAISDQQVDESAVYPAAMVNPAIFEYVPPEPKPDVTDVEVKTEQDELPPAADDDEL